MGLISLVYVLITLIVAIYFIVKRTYSYWKDRNVFTLEPTFFYGNLKNPNGERVTPIKAASNLYKEAIARGEKFAGLYVFLKPHFIPLDLELIKCITQTHFEHFTNHGLFVNEERDPLSGHLFNLEDEKWRKLRAKLTPTFTSGKMKMMFQTMVDCTKGLEEMLNECEAVNDAVDIKDVLGRFTTDIIGSVAFGLDIKSMKNPDSEFRKYGKYIFQPDFRRKIKIMILNTFPRWFLDNVGFKLTKNEIESFFINMVKNTVEYREKNNIYRKDFMHLLIQLKNMGKVLGDDEETLKGNHNNVSGGLSLNEISAQAFVFFVAGFETSATTMTFALFELAQNQDIQEKLRQEIRHILKKHDNKLTYDAIMEMDYLEKVISETLRKHPPVFLLPRVCNKDFKVPNSDLVIESNIKVSIPVLAIHNDPKYYPDPEKFDPERFNEENKASRPACCYMPFGDGPRTCIGLRFGKLQAKVGLCSVLSNFNVKLNEKTRLPIEYSGDLILSVKNDVWLNLERLNK
ncbi:unnamed protein product [Phyllotreta striolata]|uniref:Cytochrome P450 monooxygenase n=1 Tax=Phyllotreta striolata TaxID=444603 RepID=A0A9N9TSQ9_PHYSR|nr:unnamed protein product [Phyllotreta striolata]